MTTENLTPDQENTSKCKASIRNTLDKGVKVHSRSLLHTFPFTSDELDNDSLSVSVTGDELSIKYQEAEVKVTLIAHHKSGKLYPHWITLRKALINLASLSDKEVKVAPPLDLSQFPTHYKTMQEAGFTGEPMELSKINNDLLSALETRANDSELAQSLRNRANTTRTWLLSFYSPAKATTAARLLDKITQGKPQTK